MTLHEAICNALYGDLSSEPYTDGKLNQGVSLVRLLADSIRDGNTSPEGLYALIISHRPHAQGYEHDDALLQLLKLASLESFSDAAERDETLAKKSSAQSISGKKTVAEWEQCVADIMLADKRFMEE